MNQIKSEGLEIQSLGRGKIHFLELHRYWIGFSPAHKIREMMFRKKNSIEVVSFLPAGYQITFRQFPSLVLNR